MTQETLLGIVNKIIKDYHPDKIILFGSFAKGNPRPESDIDLLIIKETKKRRVDRFVEVKRLLFENNHYTDTIAYHIHQTKEKYLKDSFYFMASHHF